MIEHLFIQNYALIDHLEIDFTNGLNIITGETGAGKSILLGALGLIMGSRADTKVAFDKNKKTIVEARFNASSYDLGQFFSANEIDPDQELIIRREIQISGKSRAFINDSPVQLKVLDQLTSIIIDFHQQFDLLQLRNNAFQIQLVDTIAGNTSLLAEYRKSYALLSKAKNSLENLTARRENIRKDNEYYQYQFDELERLAIQAGEEQNLQDRLKVLENAEEIKKVFGQAAQSLVFDEFSVLEKLREVILEIRRLGTLHYEGESTIERADALLNELSDFGSELNAIAENTEHDEETITEYRERLNELFQMFQKHQVSDSEALLIKRDEIASRLSDWSDIALKIDEAKAEIENYTAICQDLASQLSKGRKKAKPGIEKEIQSMLADLAMSEAQLRISIEESDQLNAWGKDQLQFLFAANKGSRLQAVHTVASGGESSRLMLCIKALVAGAMRLPTLIFDEIDTGISGEVANKMGKILQSLSSKHQVLLITHSPQIAAKAQKHFFVFKESNRERSFTRIKALNRVERISEIAKMLSGDPPSQTALQNAEELLNTP